MKKIVAVLLLCVMLVGVVDLNALGNYEEAGEYLKKLAIIQGDENGNLMPMSNLTREESIIILLRMLNVDQKAIDGSLASGFYDVPNNHWASKYISYAKANNLTSGMGANRFGIKEKVTTKQFLSFMLKSLNYDADWSRVDIMKKSEELGLLNGVSASENEAISRGNVFIIMKNTLNTKLKGSNDLLIKKFDKMEMKDDSEETKHDDVIEGEGSISLNINNANVELVLDNKKTDVSVVYDEAKYLLTTDSDEQDVEININGSDMTGNVSSMPLVKIILPKKEWKELELNMVHSKIKSDKALLFSDLDASFVSSQVDFIFDHVVAGDIDLAIEKGNVNFTSINEFKNASFNITSIGTVNLPAIHQNTEEIKKYEKTLTVDLTVSGNAVVNFK